MPCPSPKCHPTNNTGNMNPFDLSTTMLDLVFETVQDRLRLQGYWLLGLGFNRLQSLPTSGLFAVHVNGQRYDSHNLKFQKVIVEHLTHFDHATFFFSGTGFEVEHHIQVYHDTALI